MKKVVVGIGLVSAYKKAFYLSNSWKEAKERSFQVRSYWSVESMHWVKDEVMREDRSKIKNLNLAGNMSCLCTIELNLSQKAGYDSLTNF